tara:strand:+ start:5604 stop:6218 length:615 start_codon:yes stop_codon:yes gene_type:complete
MDAAEHNVFLKLQAYDEADGLYINTIPLKAESVDFTTDKTIPSFPIPIGAITGESTTIALDLGMSNKTVNIKGVITEQTIHKKFGSSEKIRTFTAHEIAQMIASGVDSTGLAEHQAFNEIVIAMPSKVDKNYNQVNERQIPFTWRSRGDNLKLDNTRVPLPFDFPDSMTDDGVKGFIRSFGFSFNSENVFIEFTLDFQVATILP